MKLDILAVGVHPDDVELGCSGTILHHISQGHSVGILDLTQGELGTRGNAELRLEEAEHSRQILGVKCRENINIADGFFTHNEENLRKIIRIIRKYQPSIVLANAIEDRHPDHGRAAKLTADACFLSGLPKIVTFDDDNNEQVAWRPNTVCHYMQDRSLKPDFVLDISPFIQTKLEAIYAFKSQFYNPSSDEPETPISSKNFIDSVLAKDKVYGRLINVEYAEAFIATRTIGVRSLFDIY